MTLVLSQIFFEQERRGTFDIGMKVVITLTVKISNQSILRDEKVFYHHFVVDGDVRTWPG